MTTSNYMPDVRVEIAFDSGVSTPAAARTWTDVSAYVELEDESGIDIERGRADQHGDVDPNRLTSLRLNNDDGRFTPSNPSSPYYPNVKLHRPIRVSLVWDSVTYDRFVGFIDEWALSWPGATDEHAEVTVSAVSRSARLAEGTELRALAEEEVLAAGPELFYTLGEAAGAPAASDISGRTDRLLVPTGVGVPGSGTLVAPAFGADGPTSEITAATFTANGKVLANGATWTDGTETVRVFVAAFKSSTVPGGGYTLGYFPDVAGGFWAISIHSDGSVSSVVDLGNYPFFAASETSGFNALDGAWHHIAVRLTMSGAATTLDVYRDGALVKTRSDVACAPSPLTARYIGGPPDDISAVLNGQLCQVGLFLTDVSAAEIANMAASVGAGIAGERTDQRIARYAGYAGIPDDELDLEVGLAPDLMPELEGLAGVNVLDLMRIMETTEAGLLFDGRDGATVFQARDHRYDAESAFTLDFALQHVESDFGPVLDTQGLVNDATVSNLDGSIVARSTDTVSRDENGPARDDVQISTTDPDEASSRASWAAFSYSEPKTRVGTLAVDVLAVMNAVFGVELLGWGILPGSLPRDLLEADISTRLTLTNLPSQSQDLGPDFFIEGSKETIGSAAMTVTFNISDASTYDIFTLDDDVLGLLDDNYLGL